MLDFVEFPLPLLVQSSLPFSFSRLFFLSHNFNFFPSSFQSLQQRVNIIFDMHVIPLHLCLHRHHSRTHLRRRGTRRLHLHQHRPQLLNLVLVLLKQRVLWVFVNFRFVLNGFGSVCISQGRKCLLIVIVGGGKCSYHHCFGVASKGILQESRKLRVTVWNMLRSTVHQCFNYIA